MKRLKLIIKTLLTACFALCSFMLFSACSNGVKPPQNVRVTENLEIAWYVSDGARRYEVSIKCTAVNFSHPVSDEDMEEIQNTVGVEQIETTSYTSYSIEDLPEGDYEFKVRAVPPGRSASPSAWSDTIKYHKAYSTGCTYQLINSGTEYSVQQSANAKGEVYIEDCYKGKPVTQIGKSCFKNNHQITAVHLGKNIKSIGSSAFAGCQNLKEVTFEEGFTTIGEQAFRESGITSVKIPDTVNTIPVYAFYGCRSLTQVELGANVRTIMSEAFKNCSALESVSLPESLTTIESKAFHLCKALKEVTIPKNVTSIGSEAFYENLVLENVYFASDSRLTALSDSAFRGCEMLAGIVLPEGLTSIGNYVFDGCTELASVNIPSTVTYIGTGAFLGTKILRDNAEDIKYIDDWIVTVSDEARKSAAEGDPDRVITAINESVLKPDTKGIARSAFAGCLGLRTLDIPNSIEYINQGAFQGCVNLYSIITHSGSKLKEISTYVFANCGISNIRFNNDGALEFIDNYAFINNELLENNLYGSFIPDTVKRVGAHVFDGTMLYENALLVNGGSGIVYAGNWVVGHDPSGNLAGDLEIDVSALDTSEFMGIADYAFAYCANVTAISNLSKISYIGMGAFYQCNSLQAASLSSKVKNIEPYTFYECMSLNTISFPEDLASIGRSAFYRCMGLSSLDLYDTKITVISDYSFYGCANLKSVRFNPELTAISNYAFYGCSSLTEMVIPSTILSLGDRPFAQCTGLTDITIEMPMTKLPDRMFYKCTSLKNVTLPDTITEIGAYAFYQCKNLEKVVLGSNLVKIGDYAFYDNTFLHDITLPPSLTYIGKYAFKGAYNLTSLYITNNVTYIDQHAFYGAKMLTFYIENNAKTENWHVRWNSEFRPVVYNCTLSEDKTYLVSLGVADIDNSEGMGENENAKTLSMPKRPGYKFTGWAVGYGQPSTYELKELVNFEKGITVYAGWEAGEETYEPVLPPPPSTSSSSSSDSSGGNSSEQSAASE